MQELFRLHHTLNNFFWDYLPLSCAFIPADRPGAWYGVSPPERRIHALFFELHFGRRQERRDYEARCRARAAATGRPVRGSHAGMHDLVVPVKARGRHAGWVVLGPFQDRLPGRETLWSQWTRLRRGPFPGEEEAFLMYVQARLETPVLDAALGAALAPVLAEAGAALLGHAAPEAACRRLDQLKAAVLSRRTPWRNWHYADSRRDRLDFNQGPYEGGEVAPWDAEEFGLRRAPDSVVALALRDPGLDLAASLCQAARLQHAAFELCRRRPGLVAGRSGSQAAFVLAACKGRLQARDLALELHRALAKAMATPLRVSWASQPRRPEGLPEAIAWAEAGLRLNAARGLDFGEAAAEPPAAGSRRRLEGLSQDLARAFAEGRPDEARLVRRELVEAALAASAGRPELLKLELRWCLAPLLARLERRGPLDELRLGLDAAWERTPTPRELLQRFSTAVEDLGQRLARPADGERRQRLRRALDLIQERPEAPGGLAGLAREAGVSASRLSRLLKRDAGEGFAHARTQARLVKARRLLSESRVPVSAVAQECGWTSAAHFSRLFRGAEGISPSAYRKKRQAIGQ